jgi:hypothetical protein
MVRYSPEQRAVMVAEIPDVPKRLRFSDSRGAPVTIILVRPF